jgi:hypothetical protein
MKRDEGSFEIFCDILMLVTVWLDELLNKSPYMLPLDIYSLVFKNLLKLNILSHDRYHHILIRLFIMFILHCLVRFDFYFYIYLCYAINLKWS